MSETAVLTKLEYYPYGEVYSMSGGGSVYTFLDKEDPGVGMLDFGPRLMAEPPRRSGEGFCPTFTVGFASGTTTDYSAE